MVCFNPMSAIQQADGKMRFLHKRQPWHYKTDSITTLPCGQCVGCRLEYSRQWAIRCMHEASMYENNCFITLTYDNEHLPSDSSLNLDHFQRFMKRLRKRFGEGIRFYHCGEYGEKTRRPHYHACLFNFDFPDKTLFKVVNSHRLYVSQALQDLWPYGFSTIGSVTFESAAYVARYIMKKQTGKLSSKYYEVYDLITGEVFNLKPEYTTMSRRPGIAYSWFKKYKSDVFPKDSISVNGKLVKPPRYYDKLYEHDLSDFANFHLNIKSLRIENAKKHLDNNSPDRLDVRHLVQKTRLKKLPRVVE